LLDIRPLQPYASRFKTDTDLASLESIPCQESHRPPSTFGSLARPQSVIAPSARPSAQRWRGPGLKAHRPSTRSALSSCWIGRPAKAWSIATRLAGTKVVSTQAPG